VSALPLVAALHQAAALGMRLRLSGAGIKVDGLEALPQPLHATIRENASRIWSILDDGQDEIPVRTLAALNIEVILVEKRSECPAAPAGSTPGCLGDGSRRAWQALARGIGEQLVLLHLAFRRDHLDLRLWNITRRRF
jgi:hypothetical protein